MALSSNKPSSSRTNLVHSFIAVADVTVADLEAGCVQCVHLRLIASLDLAGFQPFCDNDGSRPDASYARSINGHRTKWYVHNFDNFQGNSKTTLPHRLQNIKLLTKFQDGDP